MDSFGTFRDSIAIDAPAFRRITPSLSLDYQSSGGNGWVGVGWSLGGVGKVERASPGRGAPRYDSTDIYVFDGEELVPCVTDSASPSCKTGGTHSTKTESYVRIALSGTGTAARWTITAKDGTKSIYAPVFTLPGADGTSGTGDDLVFRWGLQQVIDTKNNTVTYNWGQNQFGGLWDYLDSISYGTTTIKLHYEARTDIETSAVGAGTLEAVHGRLKTIDVSVSENRLRSYKLAYSASGATSRSLLASVQQFGKDATLDASGTVTGGTSLPAITAGYPAATSPGFDLGSSDTGMGTNPNHRLLSLDINGDGKTDMVEVWPGKVRSWISNGTGFESKGEVAIPAFDGTGRFFPMDVNGDGKEDLVILTNSSTSAVSVQERVGSWERKVLLSTGTTFATGASDALRLTVYDDRVTSSFAVGDFNGDGKTDMVELSRKWDCVTQSPCVEQGAWYLTRVTWLSNGTGFVKASTERRVLPYVYDVKLAVGDFDGDGKSDIFVLHRERRHVWSWNGAGFSARPTEASGAEKALAMDVNGDGKADIVEFAPEGSGTRRNTLLSTGSAFVWSDSSWSGWSYYSASHIVGDVNGDGKSDYIAMNADWADTKRFVFLSNGSGFVERQVSGLGSQSNHSFLAADVNGDGRTDMVELHHEKPNLWTTVTRRRVWLTAGTQPDLLTSLGGGLGSTSTVGYTPSSAWTNINSPFVTQTASAITVTDGRGGSSTTTYSYANAKWDWANQRSLGFASRRETHPRLDGESAAPYTVTTFRQDNGARGLPSRIDERDGSGTLLRAQVIDYQTNGSTVPWTALPKTHWSYTYVNTGAACPGADCKRTHTQTTYSAYGEVSREINYGDSDVTGDESTTTYGYVANTTEYIVDRPSLVTVYQGESTTGTVLHQRSFYYDGASTRTQAPSAGFATAVYDWLNTIQAFIPMRYAYDAFGNLTETRDPLDAKTTTAYDATGRFPTSVKNALGHTTTTTWDPTCGVPTRTTDANGQVTNITYDPLCRVVQTSAPAGKFAKHTWVSLGNPTAQYEQVEVPSADGTTEPRWTRRYFDGLGRTWRAVTKGPDAATGNIYADTTYNARGAQASTTEPYYWVSGTASTYTTTFGYDALDRPTRVAAPDGTQTTTSYGLWSTTEIDELGRAKIDRFNAFGQRIAHVETVGGVEKTTTYVYDARKNLHQSVDPAGNTITYATDSLGRTTSMVDPDWGTWTYEYDTMGRRTASIDPKGQRTVLEYDDLGRKLSKTSRDGTAQAATASWTYDETRTGYHNIGELTTATDGAGTKTLDYDAVGRVVSAVRTIDGTSYTFQYGFDAGDRRLWTVYPDGDKVGTAAAPLRYDSAGRLKSVPGYVTSVTYAADGQIGKVANANGTTTTRTVSPARGWLTGISTTSGATSIQNLTYTRNAKGLVTRVQSTVANEGWTYGYDDLDRLTNATNATTATHNQTWTYDAIGNITSNSRRGAYEYGTRPHAVTAAGTSAYTYDEAGLMVSAPDRTLTWDGDNRLASVTSAGTTTTFTYDADGARIQALEGSTNRRYVGDDYEITNLNVVTKYVSVGGLTVAKKEGTTITWLHTDHLGSVQAQTNASGVEVHRKVYRPYGEIVSTSGSLDDEPVGFTGQRHDGSGLVYLHARYYDPALGRFISPDFIIDGGDTVGLNRYAYVGNDPVNASDPTGLSKQPPKAHATRLNKRTSGLNAAQRVSAAGGDVNVNRPAGLGYVRRSAGASRTTQIRSERVSNGGTLLTTKHGTFYFEPKREPSPAAVSAAYAPAAPVSAPAPAAASSGAAPAVPVPATTSGGCYECWALGVAAPSEDYRSLYYSPDYARKMDNLRFWASPQGQDIVDYLGSRVAEKPVQFGNDWYSPRARIPGAMQPVLVDGGYGAPISTEVGPTFKERKK